MNTEVHFENISRVIERELRNARNSVRVCVAWINPTKYGPAFVQLTRKGVTVELIRDDQRANRGWNNWTGYQGFHIYFRKPLQIKQFESSLHHKFCIIDERIVISGSNNWSSRADSHFENVMIVRDDYPPVVRFMHEFYDLVELNKSTVGYCNKFDAVAYNAVVVGDSQGQYNDARFAVLHLCSGPATTSGTRLRGHLGTLFQSSTLGVKRGFLTSTSTSSITKSPNGRSECIGAIGLIDDSSRRWSRHGRATTL